MRKVRHNHGYVGVRAPQAVDRTLWECSGHWSNYTENVLIISSENRGHAVKPMNCSCHVQTFNQGLKFYHDPSLRLAEFGTYHHNESSDALHRIMRVYGFT